jgi:hypothetical protein
MWLSSINYAKQYQKKYPARYKVIRYESLVYQPEMTLRDICAFIGEDYTSEMLSMKGAEMFRDEGGNSSYGQHEPGRISTKSIGRFRQVLSPRKITFMQKFAGREMLAYDYPLENVQLSPGDQFWFFLVDLHFNLMRMLAWRLREAYLDRAGRTLPDYRIVTDPEALKAGA